MLDKAEICNQAAELLPLFGRVFGSYEKMQVNTYGLTVPQSYTLLTLYQHKLLTMNELSSHMRVAPTTMTRVVDILVRNGYLDRFRNEEDRRIVEVGLTEKGQQTSEGLLEMHRSSSAAIFDRVPSSQQEQMLSCLWLLLGIMEDLFVRPDTT